MSPLTQPNAVFVSRMLEGIALVDSVIPLHLQDVGAELLRNCHENSDVLRTSQYLMTALERDFLEELDCCGGKATHRPAPSAAAAALFGKREQELIDVVEISKNDWFAFGRIFLKGQGAFFEELLRKLGDLLCVPDFLFSCGTSGPVTLRLPPPSAYLGALAVFNEGEGLMLQPTSGASAPREVRDLLAKGMRPWRLDALPYDVHGRKDQHPYIGVLHDLLHALRLARIPAAVRADLVLFFDALQKTAVDLPRLAEIEEILLEGPFDDQFGKFSAEILYERLFRQVNAYLGGETTKAVLLFADDFYARLREEFSEHPREKSVLHAFAKEVYRKRFPSGASATRGTKSRKIVMSELLHMRPATLLARLLTEYPETALWVVRADGRRQPCKKSLVSLQQLVLRKDEEVAFEAEGPDAGALLDRIDKINAGGWRRWETTSSVMAPSTDDLTLEGVVACVEKAMERFGLSDLCGVLDPESRRLYLGRPEWGHAGTALAADLKHVTDYSRINFTRTDGGEVRAYFPEDVPLENIGGYLMLKRILDPILRKIG